MSRMRALFGPVYYQPRTAWGPFQALAVMIAAHVLASVAAVAAVFAVRVAASPLPISQLLAVMGPRELVAAILLPQFPMLHAALLCSALLTGAAWWLARRRKMRAADVLALRLPGGGGKVLLLIGVVVVIYFAIEYAVRYFATPLYASEEAHQVDWVGYVREAGWPVAILTVGMVGPVSEELWLRGFLLPALAKTPLGFWGAGLVTSVLFAAGHGAQYTFDLLVPIFFSGLVFVWALGLTGSLWLPIAIHMFINLLALFWVWLFALA